MTLPVPTDDPSWRLFQQRFGALRRKQQIESGSMVAAVVVLFVAAAIWTDFSPGTLLRGAPRVGEYFGKLLSIEPKGVAAPIPVLALPHLFGGVKQPQSIAYWFYRFNVYVALLWQTIQMAILATALGASAALALSFPATGNFVRSRTVVFVTRRLLEFMRSVPQVVLAFILVWPFGIGPLAGIVAIAVHSTGALGKLFCELNENADTGPVDGIRSVGGSWLAQMRYGVVPQVTPGFLSYALLRFEVNVRSSTIIGFVGAGGIGQELKRVIGFNIYEEVSAICIMILLIVVGIDLLSAQIRHRVIGALA